MYKEQAYKLWEEEKNNPPENDSEFDYIAALEYMGEDIEDLLIERYELNNDL